MPAIISCHETPDIERVLWQLIMAGIVLQLMIFTLGSDRVRSSINRSYYCRPPNITQHPLSEPVTDKGPIRFGQ